MSHRLTTLTTLALSSCLFFSCGKSETEEEPAAATAVGPPAAVMAEIAAWQAVGGKTELRDLTTKPAAPGTRNAADLHKPLIEIMQGMSIPDRDTISDLWSSSTQSVIYVLESYERELATIREAVALPYCNWGTQFEEGFDTLLPYLAYGRSAGRLLVSDAFVRAGAGDYKGAAASLQDVLRLSDHIGAEAFAINLAVRFSLDRLALDAVERLFQEHLEEAAGIREMIAARDYRAELKRALLFEGTIVLHEYRKAAGGDVSGPIEQQPMSGSVVDELIWYLKVNRLFVEQSQRPHFEMTALAEAPLRPLGSSVLQEATDPETIDRICKWAAASESLAAVAITAFELRNHYNTHGSYPDPATYRTPMDVLAGKPISYSRYSDGFLLRAEQAGFSGERVELEWEW